jgi:ABC-type antimicrobial peptide transport system permease subunit
LQPLLLPWRLGATVFVVFGLLALTIAAVGLIVVTSDAVTRRRHELAVRTACGAESGQLVRLVLFRSMSAMLAGLVVGVVAAKAGASLLEPSCSTSLPRIGASSARRSRCCSAAR